MNNTDELSDIAQHSILLDSNVIISLFYEAASPYYREDALVKIKMAAVTCDNFLVLESTRDELYKFGETRLIKINEKFYNSVADLLSRKIFRTVTRIELSKIIKQESLIAISSRIRRNRKYQASEISIENDVLLIALSKLFTIPVFTYDMAVSTIINLDVGNKIAELQIPFPFDSEALRDIDFDELLDLSQPFRRLYRRAFQKIKDEFSTSDKLKKNTHSNSGLLRKHRQVILELNQELKETQDSLQTWKNFAKPNMNETIIWTIVELGLGVIPFPIPTSPVSHFIQAMRYKKMDKE